MPSHEQLSAILARPGYAVASGLPSPEPKPKPRAHRVDSDETPKVGRASIAVVVTRCSTSRLDRDNLWAAAKAVVDGLRDGGFIAGDTESDIELIALQKKVKRADIGTLIQIVTLP